jgi:hypothetical protein
MVIKSSSTIAAISSKTTGNPKACMLNKLIITMLTKGLIMDGCLFLFLWSS